MSSAIGRRTYFYGRKGVNYDSLLGVSGGLAGSASRLCRQAARAGRSPV